MTTKTTTISAKPVYLDLHAAATFVSLSEAMIQKLVRENEFPPPRKISANRVAFHAFQRRRLCRPRLGTDYFSRLDTGKTIQRLLKRLADLGYNSQPAPSS
ncbi:helix-turn-helix transcriptional regulator [Paraburkholderia youngii]|uniref:helix-turn-helix transcriptional regulator n=1 Tax=Paraburkholderia youngii TaxID=2782701 RepID=UPI001FE8DE40|nr:AlpA family phage regulatory protein [Paraburkholderia youngii]